MKNRFFLFFSFFLCFVIGVIVVFIPYGKKQNTTLFLPQVTPIPTVPMSPLSIANMRQKQYSGSNIAIEQTLANGSNYNQYIASYISDGFKIYALLTVPIGDKPKSGWPVIIFSHGYIPPAQYQTTERYVAYVDAFARNGYVVFKPDYRGNGNSEGKPEGAYYSPVYTADVLNAVASMKRYNQADPKRFGMWGHSMGGNITMRVLVVNSDIKAAVIWGGVVGTYDELMTKWKREHPFVPSDREIDAHVSDIRKNLVAVNGMPSSSSAFWKSIDPRFHIANITAPLQLHQGLADEEVPPLFSESFKVDLEKAGKIVELYEYPNTDHNLSQSFTLAMERSVTFFDKYLKNQK